MAAGLCFASSNEAESPVARILIVGDLDSPMPAATHVDPIDQAHRYMIQRCVDAFYQPWLTGADAQPGEDGEERLSNATISRYLWIIEGLGAGALLLVYGIVVVIRRQWRLTRRD